MRIIKLSALGVEYKSQQKATGQQQTTGNKDDHDAHGGQKKFDGSKVFRQGFIFYEECHGWA
jgi:hypothetical protein